MRHQGGNVGAYNSRYGGIRIREDRKLPCHQCGAWFIFPIAEADEFRARGWRPPKRCPACRAWRRELKAQVDVSPATWPPPPKPSPGISSDERPPAVGGQR